MGLPALKEQFDLLTAQTSTRSENVERAGEVVSFAMANLIRSVDGFIEIIKELRVLLLKGKYDLKRLFDEAMADAERCDIDMCASMMAAAKPFRQRVGVPYFRTPDGKSILSSAESLTQLQLPRVVDRRIE